MHIGRDARRRMTGAGCGTLYVVATPIGNTGDITERARRVLAEVDIIAAEDTRAAGLLLKALNIGNKLISNHKFNEKNREDHILSELVRGMDVAIVSDAGTPCISDPGGIAVRAAAERGIRVIPVCGASAVTAALSVCGFEYVAFTFFGFFPRTAKAAENLIAEAKNSRAAVSVFYESPKRVKKTLEFLEANAPAAQLCLCNDLTKTYERIYRGTPRQVLDELSANPSAEKGEYTLVCMFGGERSPLPAADPLPPPDAASPPPTLPPYETSSALSPEAAIADHLAKNGGTPKDAVKYISAARQYDKKTLYKAVNNLTKLFAPDDNE